MAIFTSVFDLLLEPSQLKGLTLRNRVMSTNHECGLGIENHMPGEAYQRYHLRSAQPFHR